LLKKTSKGLGKKNAKKKEQRKNRYLKGPLNSKHQVGKKSKVNTKLGGGSAGERRPVGRSKVLPWWLSDKLRKN